MLRPPGRVKELMLPYSIKRAYYLLMGPPMRLNGWFYRRVRCPKEGLRVQLGPGQEHYLAGWLNVDANPFTARTDLWADFSVRLPFKDSSVDLIYSHHVIEHLPDSKLAGHFKEMFRVLKPGGGIRVGGPHLGNACRKYVEGDSDWFHDFPDRRSSIGGRFVNLIFCRGEHLTGLDESYLAELATNAGFVDITFCLPTKETSLVGPDVLAKETENDFDYPHTVILEARKPVPSSPSSN